MCLVQQTLPGKERAAPFFNLLLFGSCTRLAFSPNQQEELASSSIICFFTDYGNFVFFMIDVIHLGQYLQVTLRTAVD
ncbi:hypothetical protein MPTK1_4g00250 [Marchantia polymorpha subsp. ruderalis]|uniref:Uncharacterized protein n=2 Tax=Marchantia polymorpha TaxID=3197 RepID=A0AAF6B4T2_MARPO|nr:hypothetical protein MARPO_0066s0116 [Marchantia polymorpha]BBN07016.1 hypothetical protein Mp_4g00250 [Marchantia polymorpha subsp. ruderalis]|eukprot:PTQ36168.1 hypothetical protein MARPO_0066s0116 [Marchantia polymorpha]